MKLDCSALQLSLKEHDEKQLYISRQHMIDIRNIYAVITDILHKNINKVTTISQSKHAQLTTYKDPRAKSEQWRGTVLGHIPPTFPFRFCTRPFGILDTAQISLMFSEHYTEIVLKILNPSSAVLTTAPGI